MSNIYLDTEETTEDLAEVLRKGQEYREELKSLLKDIKVPVRKMHPSVIEAIRVLFGDNYITTEGESLITFEMYLDCMDLLRNVGRATAAEFG